MVKYQNFFTPLHVATAKERIGVVVTLIDKNADINKQDEVRGFRLKINESSSY